MADEVLKIDSNNKVVAGAVTDDASQEIRNLRIDNATKGLKVKVVGGGGTGDVVGPASAVDNNVVLFNGTTGKLIKDSGLTLSNYVPTSTTVAGKALSSNITLALTDLTDTAISTPSTDQLLRFNGTKWVNGSGVATSAGSGIEFFLNATSIIGTGTNNTLGIETLSKTPTVGGVTTATISVNNNTVVKSAYLYNTALGVTSIPAGAWAFEIYASASVIDVNAEFLQNINRVRVGTGTVTTTGTGTSRTATASTGTPFAITDIDTGGTIDSDSYLQTPQGLYRITARTSDTVVTIATPSTYANESAVAYNVWKRLFQVSSGSLTTSTIGMYSVNSVQPAYTVLATDKLGDMTFGKVPIATPTTVSYTYGGSTQYTHFVSTLTTNHNDLPGLQGGTANEYYHLTSAEYTGSGTGVFARVDSPVFTTKIQTPTIELGAATDTTISRVSAGVIAVEGVTVPTETSTNTLTNKRHQPRIVSAASYTTDTGTSLSVATCDEFVITAQAGALKFNNPGGTPVQGEKIIVRIKDNGTARALTYDTQYRAMGNTLPSTTVLSKTLYMGFIYNSDDTKWDLVAVAQEA